MRPVPARSKLGDYEVYIASITKTLSSPTAASDTPNTDQCQEFLSGNSSVLLAAPGNYLD